MVSAEELAPYLDVPAYSEETKASSLCIPANLRLLECFFKNLL